MGVEACVPTTITVLEDFPRVSLGVGHCHLCPQAPQSTTPAWL